MRVSNTKSDKNETMKAKSANKIPVRSTLNFSPNKQKGVIRDVYVASHKNKEVLTPSLKLYIYIYVSNICNVIVIVKLIKSKYLVTKNGE